MTDFVEVKTKAAAEKAIKGGHGLRIIGGTFTLTLASVSPQIILVDASPVLILEGTSAPSIETWGTSAPRIVTWGTSAPRIETWGTSAPRIETRETSAPRIETRETSAPSIDAKAFSYIFIRGDRAKGVATDQVLIRLQGKSSITGGQQFRVELSTAQDWCDYYGARVEGGRAIVYKGVGAGYRSHHGGDYTPGTMPEDKVWNGRKGECERGCGLNFSPSPRHTHEFHSNPAHYLECRIDLDEMNVHFDGSYPQKCTARRVAAPLVEVDVDGVPVATESAAS